MNADQTKIKAFAELLQSEYLARLNSEYPKDPDEYPDFWLSSAIVDVKPGRKYTRLDVGRSGKYMVVNETGEIFGVKAYGVIHRGHYFGTLDTINKYNWGGYSATQKASAV